MLREEPRMSLFTRFHRPLPLHPDHHVEHPKQRDVLANPRGVAQQLKMDREVRLFEQGAYSLPLIRDALGTKLGAYNAVVDRYEMGTLSGQDLARANTTEVLETGNHRPQFSRRLVIGKRLSSGSFSDTQ